MSEAFSSSVGDGNVGDEERSTWTSRDGVLMVMATVEGDGTTRVAISREHAAPHKTGTAFRAKDGLKTRAAIVRGSGGSLLYV